MRQVFFALCCAGVTAVAAQVRAQNFSGVPGVVVNYEESPAYISFGSSKFFTEPQVYLSTPSITIMPNGDYFISNDYFGSGTNENVVKVFRSQDKGATWTQTATINQAFWSTIFQHNGDLYLWGYYEGGTNGDIVIRKSTDNGVTWTSPASSTTGLLRDGDYGGTANAPVIYNGRLWIAQSGKRVMSAPVNSNLLLASSWTLSNTANTETGPLGAGLTITEAQAVASPQTGVVILPKIGGLPKTAILRVNPNNPGQMIHPADTDFVDLPGGEKKFGAMYDPVSQKFYVLDNPVLPAHASHPDGPALIRNTAAILSSRDLYNWDVEKIFLYSDDPSREGFQYFNFAIDGDNLAVASRTAMVIPGENPPPRGHDSNLITYHTIADFRTAAPDQFLRIESGTVRRYERTQFEDAPLGNFALAASFDGSPLTSPNGLSTDAQGNIYVRETGGRMLKFDLAGNYLGAVASLPPGSTWSATTRDVTAPGRDNRAWAKNATGFWDDPLNWLYWGRPDTNEEIASFGSANTATQYARIRDGLTFTVKGLRFNSPNRYIIDPQATNNGTGKLALEADTGRASIDVLQGSHWIRVAVTLNSDTDVSIAAGQELEFRTALNLNGRTLLKTGAGRLDFDQVLSMNGGRLATDGLSPIVFSAPTAGQLTLNGGFEFAPHASLNLADGNSFDLLDGTNFFGGQTFTQLILPTLGPRLIWDATTFYADGIVSVLKYLLTGDANADGVVDAADYLAVESAFGAVGADDGSLIGDANFDGRVDGDDVLAIERHWGSELPTLTPNVPEPAGFIIIAAGAMLLSIRRRL